MNEIDTAEAVSVVRYDSDCPLGAKGCKTACVVVGGVWQRSVLNPTDSENAK